MAQAKTKDMYVGSPPAATKKLRRGHRRERVLPEQLTVNAGDSVSFIPAGFHNVDMPKKGGGPAAVPRPERPEGRGRRSTPPAPRSGSTARTRWASTRRCSRPPASARSSPTPAPRTSSPGCRGEGQADDGQVHQGRVLHRLLRHPPRHEGVRQGRQEGREGPDGQAGRGRGQEAGRRGGQGRQGPRDPGAGGEHRRARHHRQGRPGVPRHGPGQAHRRAGHDGQVHDGQGQLRDAHRVVRPRRHHRRRLLHGRDRASRSSLRRSTRAACTRAT